MKAFTRFLVCVTMLFSSAMLCSCSSDEEKGVSVDAVVINHKFNVSEDLINFAMVEATYNDAEGKTKTVLISRPNWQDSFTISEFPATIEMSYDFGIDPDPKDDFEWGVQYTCMVVGGFEVIGRCSDGSQVELHNESYYFNAKQSDIFSYIRGIKPIRFRAVINRNGNGEVTVDYQAL